MGTARLYAWSREHPLVLDSALAGLILLFSVGFSQAGRVGVTAVVVAVLTAAPVAVRRRWPVAVLVWIVVLSFVQLALVSGPLVANVVQPLVLYTVAAHVASRVVRAGALGIGLVGCVLGPLHWTTAGGGGTSSVAPIAVSLMVFLVVVWLLGDLVRAREGMVERLREANAALARDREQRDQLVASRERLAVARDVHDVVAHSLSVVVVQADGASYAAEHDGAWSRLDAVRALTAIGATARDALGETRRVVGVLRDDEGVGLGRRPPGLDDIPSLVEAVRAAGVDVSMAGPADGPRPSAEAGLAAYRVVQEGLTNLLKHAGDRARGEVLVERVPGGLRVTVADDGTGAGPAAGGNGLAGMRERVAAAGGSLVAGPRARGGYAVTATLPLQADGGRS